MKIHFAQVLALAAALASAASKSLIPNLKLSLPYDQINAAVEFFALPILVEKVNNFHYDGPPMTIALPDVYIPPGHLIRVSVLFRYLNSEQRDRLERRHG